MKKSSPVRTFLYLKTQAPPKSKKSLINELSLRRSQGQMMLLKNGTATTQTTVEQATNHQENFVLVYVEHHRKLSIRNTEINLTQKQIHRTQTRKHGNNLSNKLGRTQTRKADKEGITHKVIQIRKENIMPNQHLRQVLRQYRANLPSNQPQS